MMSTENRRLSQVLRVTGETGLRESARFGPARLGGEYALKVAADRATRERACRLVYEQYLEKGYTQRRASGAWITLHDALPETVALVVERAGQVMATGTVVPDSPLRLPADEIYAQELAALRQAGRRPTEVISLAAIGDLEDSRITLSKLFHAIYVAAHEILGATDLVITVNPRHVPFYRRLLQFEDLAGERECRKVAGAPAVLLRLPLEKAGEYFREAADALPGSRVLRTLYPMMAAEQREVAGLADSLRASVRPMGREDLAHFLIGLSSVLENARPAERRYLQSCYPQCDFAQMFLTTTVRF